VTAMPVNSACDQADAGLTETSARRSNDDIKTFVAAISIALRESVTGFEDTVNRITEIVAMQPGRADRELVVALQSFDRLQQEFTSLGEVLARLSAISGESALLGQAGPSEPGDDVLATISISGLKDRLSRHLRSMTLDLSVSDGSDETVF
jgi:hypothetical protein